MLGLSTTGCPQFDVGDGPLSLKGNGFPILLTQHQVRQAVGNVPRSPERIEKKGRRGRRRQRRRRHRPFGNQGVRSVLPSASNWRSVLMPLGEPRKISIRPAAFPIRLEM